MTQMDEPLAPVQVPEVLTPEWAMQLQRQLDQATRAGVAALKPVLTLAAVRSILERAEALFKAEATLIELNVADPEATVSVVGDTHGQFHDVCKLFAAAGYPSEHSYFVFNGDYVDRGAWGLETLVLLLAWKLALPHRVFMLRGNHESATCTVIYGFKEELKAKYGKSIWQEVYTRCKRVFSVLPLAALVQLHTLVLHGGLFRSAPRSAKPAAKNKRKRGNPVLLGSAPMLGTLDDLRAASRGGMDPSGIGSNRLASDVLWSDPTSTPGFEFNVGRGIGMTFGPDVTERFLLDNQLRLVLRSHEGPDAREGRDDMAPMTEGWTLDHDTPCGKLMTVFSAPEYPQFVGDELERCHNRAAVAVLSAPDYASPRMVQFDADLPRPEAQPYYALDLPGSDDEFEPAASDISGMSSIDAASDGAMAPVPEDMAAAGEVDQQPVLMEQQAQDPGQSLEEALEAGAAARGSSSGATATVGSSLDDSSQEAVCSAPAGQPSVTAGEQPGGGDEVLKLFVGLPLVAASLAVAGDEASSDGSKENVTDNDNEMVSAQQQQQLEGFKAAAAAQPVEVATR